MSGTNDNTSTLKAAYDSVTGAAQDALGSVLGSTGDKAEGQARQDKASAEYDASHTTLKGPGFAASSSGAVTKDNPDRTSGSWNQTVGSAEETLGGLTGSESLKQRGRQQNLAGQEQEAAGQINDFASGAANRVTGTVGSALSGLTGNAGAEAEYKKQHDFGKTQQRSAEHDIQKQAEAKSS